MKKLTTLIALAAIAGSAYAATIVNYDPVAEAGSGGGWEGAVNDWDTTNSTYFTRNFDTTTGMYGTGTPVYSGGSSENRLTSDGSINTGNTGSYRMIRTDPIGDHYTSGAEGAGTTYNNVNVVYLFKKADFIGGPASVSFEAASTLSVNISSWFSEGSWTPGALTTDIRHIVKQAGQAADTYWISEANVDDTVGGVGTFTLTDFNNNSTAGKGWAEITLSNTDFDIGTKLDSVTWQAVDFTDVQSVGFVGEGSKKYGGNFAFDNYTATAIPEPATLGLVAVFGGAVLVIRRRLMM